MPVYTFPFTERAAGLTVNVLTENGTIVNTGTVTSTPDETDAYVYSATLDEDGYVGVVVTESGHTLYSNGKFDIVASIEAGGGGVGAAETAYFVATGPADVTDGNGVAGNLTFVADDRHDALPSWASVIDGDIVLSEDAGTIAYSFNGVSDMDFSGTTAPTSAGLIGPGFSMVVDGVTVSGSVGFGAVPGDGQDAQTTGPAKIGGVGAYSVISAAPAPVAYSDDGSTVISDGVATPRVALTVTRIAQAAVLPEPA